MRLVNYGAGELTDRLTILALKVLYGTEAGTPVAHFEQERAVLLTQIRSRTLNGVWFEQVLGLGAVNAALWHAEDDLRDYRIKYGGRELSPDLNSTAVVQLAFRIQDLNDRRAELVRTINQSAGDESAKEKLT